MLVQNGGAVPWESKNEVDPTALAPFQTTPVLMINGEYDNVFPLETSSRPLFDLIGADDKMLKLYNKQSRGRHTFMGSFGRSMV